jgi:hypothetical protein
MPVLFCLLAAGRQGLCLSFFAFLQPVVKDYACPFGFLLVSLLGQ